jgi:hypothetical protein
VLLLVLVGCTEPKLTDPNSAQAATATYRIAGSEVTTGCAFTFDRETQRYEVSDTGLPPPPG